MHLSGRRARHACTRTRPHASPPYMERGGVFVCTCACHVPEWARRGGTEPQVAYGNLPAPHDYREDEAEDV